MLEPIVAGMRFGPCALERFIGAGGMGEVWLARNAAEGRAEAVKILTEVDAATARERFIREAMTAIALGGDERIVRTYDAGEANGRLYIRMEFVEGRSLDAVERVAPADALALFKRLAGALAAGHARGLVHRDVKPANFIRARDGRVKLMDFGVARSIGLGAQALTRTGDALGTPAYMSPEQWGNAREADARADVYSLGVTMYRLLSGRLPFDAEAGAPGHVFYAKLLTEEPLPLEAPPGVPDALVGIIMKAMAKRPDDRFPDAVALREALGRLGRGKDVDLDGAPPRRVRARRVVLLVLLGLALASAAGLGVSALLKRLLVR